MSKPTTTHQFTLILPGLSDLTPDLLHVLYESGCRDATPALRGGRVHLTFARAARSRDLAVGSATWDLARAGYEAVEEPTP